MAAYRKRHREHLRAVRRDRTGGDGRRRADPAHPRGGGHRGPGGRDSPRERGDRRVEQHPLQRCAARGTYRGCGSYQHALRLLRLHHRAGRCSVPCYRV